MTRLSRMKNFIRKSVQELHAYVPGEQPQGRVIKLNTNENPYPPTPAVTELLQQFDVAELRKYPDPVCSDLRHAIAQVYGVEYDQVFVGNGSDEILALCIRAFVEPATGNVGYFDPSYSLYPILADIEDVQKSPVALDAQFGWQMPADYTASLFFLTQPNAPTSLAHPLETIREFVNGFPGVVLIDEAYGDFADENCMTLASEFENVIVSRTFSKSYALAGIRCGYCIGPKTLINAMYKIKDSYNLDMLTQNIATVAIQDQAWMKACAEKIRTTRQRTTDALTALGFSVCPSQANFLWVQPPTGTDAKALFESLKEKQIFVRYFANDPQIANFLRITIGTDTEIDEFLNAVRVII